MMVRFLFNGEDWSPLSMFVTLDEVFNRHPSNVFDEQEEWVVHAERKLLKSLSWADSGYAVTPKTAVFLEKYTKEIANISNNAEGLKILEIGGGVGHLFPLIRLFVNKEKPGIPIAYSILEGENYCQKGRTIFSSFSGNEKQISYLVYYPDGPSLPAVATPSINETSRVEFSFNPTDKIEFHNDIGSCGSAFDVVICANSLSYIDDLTGIVSLIDKARPKFVFFSYFLAMFEGPSVGLGQLFGEDFYMEVTSHSVDSLQSRFADINYKMLLESCRQDQYPAEECSDILKQRHSSMGMADIYFIDVGTPD